MRQKSKVSRTFVDPDFQSFIRSKFRLNDDGNLVDNTGQPVYGSDNGRGYRTRTVSYQRLVVTLLVHRLVFFLANHRVPGEIDHIDNDKQNNTISNLREITHRANMGRMPKTPGKGSSPYKGISRTRSNRWQAYCAKNYLGTYTTPEEAARAYDAGALEYYGPLAWLNFPPKGDDE